MALVDRVAPGLDMEQTEVFRIALAVAKITAETGRRVDITDLVKLCVSCYRRWQATTQALEAERLEVQRLNLMIETYRRALIMTGIEPEMLDGERGSSI